MVWTTYKEKIKRLSDAVIDAQKPIRILDAIKWPSNVDEQLRKSKFKDMPKIDKAYYDGQILGFDPQKKIDEFTAIIAETKTQLGDQDELGQRIIVNCQQYQDVVRMLMSRGTKDFYKYSKKLYGSPKDTFQDEVTSINDISHVMYNILSIVDDSTLVP